MKKILCGFVIVLLMFSLFGCSLFESYQAEYENIYNSSNGENNSSNANNSSSNETSGGGMSGDVEGNPQMCKLSSFAQNSIKESPKPNVLKDDAKSRVFSYHMGALSKVPIAYERGMEFVGESIFMSFSKESIQSDTIRNVYETCVKTMISASVKLGFSVSGGFEYASVSVNGEISTSGSLEDSTKNTVEKAISKTEALESSMSLTLTSKTCKIGYSYRYVLVSGFNVYYVVEYDKETKKISNYYYLEEIPGQQNYYFEECAPNNDFWGNSNLENVDYPTVNPIADGINASTFGTTFVATRSGEASVDDSGRQFQPKDIFSIKNMYGYTVNELKKMGYTKIIIKFSMQYREVNDGYQWVYLNSYDKNSGDDLAYKKFEHSPNKVDKNWKEGSATFELDLNLFDDLIVIGYGASGGGKDAWKNKDIKVIFTLK